MREKLGLHQIQALKTHIFHRPGYCTDIPGVRCVN
jgi:hypothetical protein